MLQQNLDTIEKEFDELFWKHKREGILTSSQEANILAFIRTAIRSAVEEAFWEVGKLRNDTFDELSQNIKKYLE
jgi:hypothetical protein